MNNIAECFYQYRSLNHIFLFKEATKNQVVVEIFNAAGELLNKRGFTSNENNLKEVFVKKLKDGHIPSKKSWDGFKPLQTIQGNETSKNPKRWIGSSSSLINLNKVLRSKI